MRKTLRLGLLAAAAATTLAFASSAFGAYAPKLIINQTDENTVIRFSQTDADDPTAKVQILVIHDGTSRGWATTYDQTPRAWRRFGGDR